MRPLQVASLDDPRVADYRDVREAELRWRSGLFLAEGRLHVKRLIGASRYRTRSVLLSDAALAALRPTLEHLGEATPIYLAPQALLERVVGYAMHRGCLAVGERGAEPSADALLASLPVGARRVVVLEDVSNPENVGGIFRNALAFGADAVLLTRRSVDPLYRRAIRVSMGASLRVPFARTADAAEAAAALGRAGFASLALTTNADAPPLSACRPPSGRLALWLGGEAQGLSAQALAAVAERVRIPMAAGADSLNVATASGIALHHFHCVPKIVAPPVWRVAGEGSTGRES